MSVRERLAGWLLGKDARTELAQAFELLRMRETPKRGTRQLIEAYSQSPWLQAVTKKIAERVTMTRWELYAQVGAGGKAVSPNGWSRGSFEYRHARIKELKQAGEIQQIFRHPLLDMLATGNPLMTGYAARLLTQLYRDIVGECFWALSRNQAGKPSEFWPIPANWVTETSTPNEPFYKMVVDGSVFRLPAEDVIWFREPDPANPYGRGVGVAQSLGDEIETDEYAARFIKTFFHNRAKPEVLVGIEGMSTENLVRAKREFLQQHQGYRRAHGAWFYNTKIDVKELTQKFTDMELTELRQWERDTFISTFGVPPEQLGIVTSSNRATAHESESIMARSVLSPRLESFREQLQDELVPQYDPRLVLEFVSPVPEDRDFQLEAIRAASWAATRGEIRKIQGLQDRGEGDNIHLQPMNLFEAPAPAPESVPAELRSKELVAHVTKDLTEDEVEEIVRQLQPDRITAAVEPVWLEELQEWAADALEDVNAGISFNMLSPKVVDHMETFLGDRIVEINNTTRKELTDTLIEGVRGGEGIADLKKRVAEVYGQVPDYRAERIARTETVRSASFASQEAWTQSQVVWGKRWLSLPDARSEHFDLNGVAVEIGANFEVDGFSAPYPGEFGDPSQDINCRCSIAPVIDPEGAAAKQTTPQQLASAWRETEARRLKWEKAAEAAFVKGFRAQQQDLIKALEEANRT